MVRTFAVAFITVIACVQAVRAEGMSYQPPVIGSFHPLSETPDTPSCLVDSAPALLKLNTALFEDREVIDFEKREISFERVDKTYGYPLWQYRYDELDSYLASRQHYIFLSAFYRNFLSLLTAPPEKKKGLTNLEWALPVQYPSWAQRILGKEPPKLSITGYEKIIVSYEYNKTDLPGSNVQNQGTTGLNFDQENQFSITGSVGRLIGINIKGSTKQGAEMNNDPLKNFKLEYKGEGDELEDEIVQEVVAGYTGFDMPGTSLSGFSESHEGLFGIKVRSKIGPLSLTTIVSHEQGESQKTTLYPSGQGESVTSRSEKEYLRNKIFFLDTMYLKQYVGLTKDAPEVDTLFVWITNVTMKNTAAQDKQVGKTGNVYKVVGTQQIWYKKLIENRDYFVDRKQGSVLFDSVIVNDADAIGIHLVTKNPAVIPNKGANIEDTVHVNLQQDSLLWTLKPPDQQDSTSPTFMLMWRNVYLLPSPFDKDKFKLRVTRYPPDTLTDKAGTVYFSYLLGLTDDRGIPLVNYTQIFDDRHGVIILPPDTVAHSNEPFSNPKLGTGNTNRDIYRKTLQNDFNTILPQYQMVMSGSSRKTSFNLGFGGVMEGTEVLKVGGQRLDRGTDYLIDYQMGQIDLLSKRALAADRIDVEYQSEALFIPKQKVFLGARGEMKLPIGEKSFLGASILYQDASSNDRVPKINQEPYTKLLLDVNAMIDFEPEWMTKAVNALPLIATEAKSTASLEIEMAHSRTNPNTGGEAYVDDFESSKETDPPIGLTPQSWYQSSPPWPYFTGSNGNDSSGLLTHPPAWIQYWFSPLVGDQQVLKDSIFAQQTKKYQSAAEDYEPVLSLDVLPAPPTTNPLANRFDDPWAGIMTYFQGSSSNMQRKKYLEFWAQTPLCGGRLYVDMGEVSEDLSLNGGPPNGLFDYEDKPNTGILADSLNIGLDGLKDEQEYYCVPNETRTGWDTLRYGNPLLPYQGDPSKDNYQQYSTTGDLVNNYKYTNGTEKDGLLNTEDIAGDGWHRDENVFRRYIDFDSTNNPVFLSRNAGNYQVSDSVANARPGSGWHLYRVPLNDVTTGDDTTIHSPSWTNIRFLRIWWKGFGNRNESYKHVFNRIRFARMQFVGNQWLESPVKRSDSSVVVKLGVSTLNTEDNPPPAYDPPPAVYRATDEQGNLARETSLRLGYNEIYAGDTALVKKNLAYQPLNISTYGSLELQVHGDTARTDLWYFMRFGADDSTYYEYRTPVTFGWKTLSIQLRDISELKRVYQEAHGDTAAIYTSAVLVGGNIISIRSPKNRAPSFSNITYMSMGVIREPAPLIMSSPYRGAIWVDEMKVTGIKPLYGYAGHLYLNTKWADFMNLTAGFDYEDGKFKRMTEAQMGLDNSQLSTNFSVDWAMEKFLPAKWALHLPLGMRMKQELLRPQIKQNSDIFLNQPDGSCDGLAEMYRDAINMMLGADIFTPSNTRSSHYQTTNFSRDWWTAYEKKSVSTNPLVNFTLDRTAIDLAYGFKASQTAKGQVPGGGKDKLDEDTTHSYHGTLKYNLSPTHLSKWKPFENSKAAWLPDRWKTYELSYLPTTLTFDIAEVTYSKETIIKGDTHDTTTVKKFELDHRMNLLFDPINILNLGYNLSLSRNLDNEASALNLNKEWQRFFHDYVAKMDPVWGRFGILYGERSRTQTASLKFDPSFLEWLSHSFDYAANYRQNANRRSSDPVSYQNLGVDGTFHMASTLTLASLFKKLSDGLAKVKGLSMALGKVEKALTRIALNSITFDYSAKSTLRNDYMDVPHVSGIGADGFFLYQLGLYGRSPMDIITGNMRDNVFGGMRYRSTPQNLEKDDMRTCDRSYSLSTSFTIPAPVDISFTGLSFKWGKSFVVRPDTSAKDTTVTFPDYGATAQTPILYKISVVNKNMQSLQLSSGYSYQKKTRISGTNGDLDKSESEKYGFSPLVRLDGTLKKWPVNINYSHDYTITTEGSLKGGSQSKTVGHTNKLGVRYEIRKSGTTSEIKFLFWKIPIKGRIDTGLDADMTSTETSSKPQGTEDFTPTSDASSFSISPHASYDFTDNITGQVSYTGTHRKDPSQTTSTSHIFSLSVEIRF
jgi:hypothetical protein